MLTKQGCQARRQRLWARLDESGESRVDGIVLFDPASLMHLANYYPSPFEFRSNNAAAALVLCRDGSATIVVDNLTQPFAERAHVDEVVAPAWYRGVASAPPRRRQLTKSVLDYLKTQDFAVIGVDAGFVPTGLVEGLREHRGKRLLVDVEAVAESVRRGKDADELAILRRAIAAAEAGFAAAREQLRPGMSEQEMYRRIAITAMQSAGEPVLVYGDFLSGPRCGLVGGPATERILQAGDLVLLDFSVVLYGYRGDFAATFVLEQEATPDVVELHAACLRALAAGETQLRAGVECRRIDREVRGSFAAQDLADNFKSHGGHGIGLGHPEAPFIVPESNDTLVDGDVVTLEPGQYVGGVGIRVERNYRITVDGFDCLSRHDLALRQRP